MSGIFGIFNRNGKPVSPEIIQKMLDAFSCEEPDDRSILINGSVALGHSMIWNTPESKFEQLPNTEDSLSVTMDARLDNREELATKLGLSNLPIEQVTDSDFILKAYREWGDDCPRYLLGDFVFAIWDDQKKQLFCARDHIGIKPFYYHYNNGFFIFANDIDAFWTHPGIEKKLNEKSIAYYLRGEDWLHDHTFFEDIQKLPPASSLTLTKETMLQNQYWLPENSPRISFESVEACAVQMRELIELSVKARLRSAYSIASHLSGGLDSSGITVIASRFLQKDSNKLLAYNWVAEPGLKDDPDYYEWAFSKQLADSKGIEHHYVNLTRKDLAKIFSDLDITTNDTVDLWYEFMVRKTAKNKNCRVILSGWGGDEIVTSYGRGFFSDLFLQGKVIQSIKSFKHFVEHRKYTIRQFLKSYFGVTIWRLLPINIRCFLRESNCYKPLITFCLHQKFSDFVNHTKKPGADYSEKTVRDVQLGYLKVGHLQQRTESWSISAVKDKIEYRYPLLDKRLIEFVLGIPAEYLIKGKTSRYLYREAMKGILPENIRLNTEKDEPKRVALFHELTLQALKIAIREYKDKPGKYIDHKCLLNTIHHFDNVLRQSREKRTNSIDGLTRAFLVLNSKNIKKLETVK